MPQTDGHILLIDDDDANRELLSIMLEEAGFVVTVAASRAEALAILAGHSFDIIVTDSFARLPEDVLTATAPLVTAAGRTPTVLLTAHRPDRERARQAGFGDVLFKPIDLDDLEARLRALLPSSD